MIGDLGKIGEKDMAKSKKGSAFERSICKLLSTWYSHGKRDDIFWRTAGSGARATTRMKKGMMTADSAGDMCAIDESGKVLTAISIWEFKRGYTSKKQTNQSINLISILDKMHSEKDPMIIKWFEKLQGELKDHKRKLGFIIFKRDRKNACIAFDLKTFKYLKSRNIKKCFYPPFGPISIILCYKVEFVVFLLEDFLRWCEPESIGRKIKRRMRGLVYEQDPKFKKWVDKQRSTTNYSPINFKVDKTPSKIERFLSVSRNSSGMGKQTKRSSITRRRK